MYGYQRSLKPASSKAERLYYVGGYNPLIVSGTNCLKVLAIGDDTDGTHFGGRGEPAHGAG